ncbi:hypothetical protein [Arsenophonus sp.]|uniref:hypothetical protein n=1 Tax=Arsenophonus sp. TaxID=1872640 RepID=UPI0038798EFB
MIVQVMNHQPFVTKIGRIEDLFYCHLDIHTHTVLAALLNNNLSSGSDVVMRT